MNRKGHWDSIYQSKSDEDMSWTLPEPLMSLKLIGEACSSGRVLDVGGGTSTLAEKLLDQGYEVIVLDISEAALERDRKRLGAKACDIRWIAADVTAAPDLESCDVWHDRAVFHFLTSAADRAAYRMVLEQTVSVGGYAVIGTFTLDGSEKCSGLEVQRYDGQTLAAEVGPRFSLLKCEGEVHITPWGARQTFQYSVFKHL